MTENTFPALPLEEWADTKQTLHLYAQIVGKVRLGMHPRMNHWWHAPLYVSTRGLTTGPIPHRGRDFELEFNFLAHHLSIRASSGEARDVPLGGSVADFYQAVIGSLGELDIHPKVIARPFDESKVGSNIPFAEDNIHSAYDAAYVERFWHILVGVEGIFKAFRGRYLGKSSPVHFFWHSFDLAVTRFSGKPVELPADADPVTREAYSHEVISAGFWPGDDNMPEPAFYTYAAPEPQGLSDEPLQPSGAWWQDLGSSSMAMYRYNDFREAPESAAALLSFLQSSYNAGAKLGGWPGDLDREDQGG